MNRDKINAALAIGEKYGVIRCERTVAMPRVCAAHNRYYAAIYMALPNGRYRFKECVPVVNTGGGQGPMQNVDLSQIEDQWLNAEKCLWCGNGVVARCGQCNQFVCCGRVKGQVFKCCDACGSEAVMSGTYSSFTASKQVSTTALRAPTGQASLRAPCKNTLMLASGTKR